MAAPQSALPPPPPSRYNLQTFPYGKLAVGVAAGGAIALVGYGVYQYISSQGPGQTVSNCQVQWQQAFDAYTKEYQAFLRANNGAALSQQQEASLQGYVSLMNSAEQCQLQASNANTQTWATALTAIALGVAATYGLYRLVNNYLGYKKGLGKTGQFQSGSEARAVTRNAAVQNEVDSGDMSAANGQGAVKQTQSTEAADASAESTALGSAVTSEEAVATQAGDTALLENLQEFTSTIIDTIVENLTAAYDYVIALF